MKPPLDLTKCAKLRDRIIRATHPDCWFDREDHRDLFRDCVLVMTYLLRRTRVAEAKLKELRSK